MYIHSVCSRHSKKAARSIEEAPRSHELGSHTLLEVFTLPKDQWCPGILEYRIAHPSRCSKSALGTLFPLVSAHCSTGVQVQSSHTRIMAPRERERLVCLSVLLVAASSTMYICTPVRCTSIPCTKGRATTYLYDYGITP